MALAWKEAVGASLCANKILTKLDLEANRITPRAAMALAECLMMHPSLNTILMGMNPLGTAGARAVMRLPGEMHGSASLNVNGCNFRYQDPTCWFDDDKLLPHYTLNMEEPYDRAVALYLLRRAGRDEGLRLTNVIACTLPHTPPEHIHLILSSDSDYATADNIARNINTRDMNINKDANKDSRSVSTSTSTNTSISGNTSVGSTTGESSLASSTSVPSTSSTSVPSTHIKGIELASGAGFGFVSTIQIEATDKVSARAIHIAELAYAKYGEKK